MPRYIFDIQADRFDRDEEGVDLADFAAARAEAIATLPAIAREAIPMGGDIQDFIMMVRDEAGAIVYTASLMFAGVASVGQSNT